MTNPILVIEYDPKWPERFGIFRTSLANALDDLAAAIEHVGSTAVPTLPPSWSRPAVPSDTIKSMADPTDFTATFLDYSRVKLLDQSWPRLRSTVESLTDEQIWWRPNEASNSIGNLLLHLNGNVRQWLVTSFNQHPDARHRSAEFDERDHVPARVLLDRLGATLDETAAVLNRLTADDLAATLDIQGYSVSGFEAIYHVVEHFSLHYGQICYIAKMLQARDLGFYKELNATGRA